MSPNFFIPLPRIMACYLPSRGVVSLRSPGLYRGMPSDLLGYYHQWEVEDIQALTTGWYDDSPLYAGWESTNNFLDTGERTGFVTSCDPDQARKELNELSEVCPPLQEDATDDATDDEESDDDEDKHRRVPEERWGAKDGLKPSER